MRKTYQVGLGYPRSTNFSEYPLKRVKAWGKFWSKRSNRPPYLGFLGNRLWRIRELILNDDAILPAFLFIISYLCFMIPGALIPIASFPFYWIFSVTGIYVAVLVFLFFWLGSKLIYTRTQEGSTVMWKLLTSDSLKSIPPRMFNAYVKKLLILDEELARIDTSRISLIEVLETLPNMEEWDPLGVLSFEVDSVEHGVNASSVQHLRDEISQEINRLYGLQKTVIDRMETELSKALNGYDPVALAECKKLAEKAVSEAKNIRLII